MVTPMTLERRLRIERRDVAILTELIRRGKRLKRNTLRLRRGLAMVAILETVASLPTVESQLSRSSIWRPPPQNK